MTVAEMLTDVCIDHQIDETVLLGRCRKSGSVSARHEFFYRALAERGKTAGWVEARYGFNRVTVLYGAARHAQAFGLKNPTGFDLKGKQERARAYHQKISARAA